MNIIREGNIVAVQSHEVLITDVQSALDLAMMVTHETGVSDIILHKSSIAEEFFILSTGLAGDVLQKYINYGIRLAIYGDFSKYTSKPLHDFIYESNQGNDFFFTATEAEAAERLSATK